MVNREGSLYRFCSRSPAKAVFPCLSVHASEAVASPGQSNWQFFYRQSIFCWQNRTIHIDLMLHTCCTINKSEDAQLVRVKWILELSGRVFILDVCSRKNARPSLGSRMDLPKISLIPGIERVSCPLCACDVITSSCRLLSWHNHSISLNKKMSTTKSKRAMGKSLLLSMTGAVCPLLAHENDKINPLIGSGP